MTATFKGFFGSLVLFMLLSSILGYTGIDIMHRHYAGPFEESNYFLPFSYKLLNFLDSLIGRVLVWGVIFVAPSFCGILAYRYGHFLLCGIILCSLALAYGCVGIKIFFVSKLYDPGILG
jgi:hypothetical protein